MSTMIKLPRGAACTPVTTPRFLGRFCLATVPGEEPGRCYRPKGHTGRHAFVGPDGTVWDVWGADEHAERRARGKAALAKKANQRLERVVGLIDVGIDPDEAWAVVEKVAAAHRAPCVDGSVCGESAHCPPEDGAR